MNPRTFAICCACVLIFGMVTSSPVAPRLSLKQFSPIDICLFMCNICFNDMGPEMMSCANDVCLVQSEYDTNLALLKLGRRCKNYKKLTAFIFGNETD